MCVSTYSLINIIYIENLLLFLDLPLKCKLIEFTTSELYHCEGFTLMDEIELII
jgi:hypothetical protein